jgi:hypothetical protein
MGLLDDAIREHLELKRQHGAPDDELERAEQEALGPARRDSAAGAGVPAVEELPGEEIEQVEATVPPPPPPPPVDDPVFADEYAVQPAPADFDEPEFDEAPPPGTAKPHGDPALGDYEEPVVHDLDEPVLDPEDPPPVVEPPDRARTSILDDPLAEPPPEPEQSEDVLEETPEFLQDAPEHDKLWFEQKPPRDFDFE